MSFCAQRFFFSPIAGMIKPCKPSRSVLLMIASRRSIKCRQPMRRARHVRKDLSGAARRLASLKPWKNGWILVGGASPRATCSPRIFPRLPQEDPGGWAGSSSESAWKAEGSLTFILTARPTIATTARENGS